MTREERQKKFTEAFREISEKYGLTFSANIAHEVVRGSKGIRHELEPYVDIIELPNWVSPVTEEKEALEK